jgi:hypothetical protein
MVIPEMAFVMAINGECREWVTPLTHELPTQQLRAKVDIMGALGTIAARPRAPDVTAVVDRADRR